MGLAALGILLLLSAAAIRLGYLPEAEDKSIQVRFEFQGAFEEEVEGLITDPLESELSRIRGVQEILSLSEQGSSRVSLAFSPETDLDRAYLRVREAVDRVRSSLPAAVQRPSIIRSGFGSRPVFIAAFPRDGAFGAEALRSRFESVPGSGEIEIGGGGEQEIRILFDPQKLAARRLSVLDLVRCLRSANGSGGFGREGEPSALIEGRWESLAQLREAAVAPGVRLSDLSEIELTTIGRESIARVDGEEKIIVYVHKAGDANTIGLCKVLDKLVKQDLAGTVLFNYGRAITSALREILVSILMGVLLVVILTLAFWGRLTSGLLIVSAIPFSVLSAVALLSSFTLELNLVTLAGIATGTGLVIDAGVILVEEVEACGGNVPLALGATRASILFSAATTLAVFLPLLFAERQLLSRFGALALTVSAALCSSLLYVFLFLPAPLSALKAGAGREKRASAPRAFRRAYFFICRHPKAFLAGISLILLGSLLSLPGLRWEELGQEQRSQLTLRLEYPSGVSLETVSGSASKLEGQLLARDWLERLVSRYEKERAFFLLTLKSKADRSAVLAELRDRQRDFPQAFFYFEEAEGKENGLEVLLSGSDIPTLREETVGLAGKIQALAQVREVIFHFKEVLPVRRITVDLQAARRLDADPYQIYTAIFWALNRPVADKWNRLGQEIDIRLQAALPAPGSLDSLLEMTVPNRQSQPITLKTLVRVTETPTAGRIYHYNRQRSLSFTVLASRRDRGTTLEAVRKLIASASLPSGYRVELGSREKQESILRRSSILSLALSLALVLIILVFQFESLKSALIILLQIPLSFVLPLLALRLLDLPVTIPYMMGLMLTAGISVNNGILVLEPLPRGRLEAGAVYTVLESKLKAILISSLTTILGVLPLLADPSGRTGLLASLSITIALGLSGSLVFLFVSLPALATGPALAQDLPWPRDLS